MKGADYVIKRLAFAVLTVFIAVTINFALFRLAPGSAVTNLARVPHATPETRQALKRSFGGHRNLRRLRAQIEECLGIAAEAALLVAH